MRWFHRDSPEDEDAAAAGLRPGDAPGHHTPEPHHPPEPRAHAAPPVAPPPSTAAAEPASDDPARLPPPVPTLGRDPGGVDPITHERVAQALQRQGYRYRLDPDGSMHGNWDGSLFTIDLIGSPATVLQVRGTWARALEPDLATGIAQVVNDWNRDRIWPKVYTRTVDGRIRIHSEVSVDLGPGASDAQVEEALACGLGTGVQLFTQLTGLIEPEDAGPDHTHPAA